MALPPDPEAQRKLLHFIAKGDPAAAGFLAAIVELVYLADDAVDEDLAFDVRQKMMSRLLWIVMVDLPRNPFWLRHQTAFSGLIAETLVFWTVSDTWKRTGDLKRKMFGYVRRENVDGIAVAVAAIVGGEAHAAQVVEELMRVCHDPSESFEDWCKEDRP